MSSTPPPGAVSWQDLTVEDAGRVRDFYAAVVGWKPEALSMGDYNDYVMASPVTGAGAAGVCHARGVNADLPPQWIIYIMVEDLDHSVRQCAEMGGKLLRQPTSMAPRGATASSRTPPAPWRRCSSRRRRDRKNLGKPPFG